jgi:LuxR family maltose regulon positive regulatory protein
MYSECMASLRRAGHIADVLGVAIGLADIRIGQGRLREAMRTYEQPSSSPPPRTGRCMRAGRRTCTSG